MYHELLFTAAMKPFIQHIFLKAMEISESRKRLQVVITPLIMITLLSSLGVSEILSSSQGAERISSVALQTVSASLEDSGSGGEEIQTGEDNQDGVQQDNGGEGQRGEQDNENTGLTSPPELTPSPTSKDFLGRGPPQLQDNILNGGGGGNIIARDCPETGPIPPDCTINPFPPTPPKCPDKGPIPPDCTLKPFPLMSGEIQGEVTPTPPPTSGLSPTLRAPLPTLNEIPPTPINCKLFPFAPSCKTPTPTPTPSPAIKAPLPTLVESPPPPINCKLFPFAPSCKTPTPTPAPSPTESPTNPDDNPVTAERGLFSPIPQ
jgi:hypothetical protein